MILIVDDDKDMLFPYQNTGEAAGVEIAVKTSVTGALDYLREVHYAVDVAILDLCMPTLDGLTLSDEIRRNELPYLSKESPYHKEKPMEIVFFTAAVINDSILKVQERNAVRKIYQKPYDLDLLMNEVKEWL